MKVTINTPKGPIEVIASTDPAYPGIYVEINGVQVALIDYDSADEKHKVRVWNGEDEDYVFVQEFLPHPSAGKSQYEQAIDEDIQAVLDGMEDDEGEPLELTEEEWQIVRQRMYKYDHSDYNEYIDTCIMEAKKNDSSI